MLQLFKWKWHYTYCLEALTSLYLLGNAGRRSSILGTSAGVAVSNMLFIAFYLLMTQSSYDMSELAFYVIAAIASGILSGALTIGLMPFFESAFRLVVGYETD